MSEVRETENSLILLTITPPDDYYVLHCTFPSVEEAVEHCNERGFSHESIEIDASKEEESLFWKLFVN